MLYVLWVAVHNHYNAFRYAEVEGIMTGLTGLSPEQLWGATSMPATSGEGIIRPGDTEKMIFLNLDPCHERAIHELTMESVTIKWSGRVLVRGTTEKEMIQAAASDIDKATFQALIQDRGSFAFCCDTHHKSVTIEENVERMNRLSFLFTKKEKANLKNPGIELLLLEDYLYQAWDDPKPWECVSSVFGIVVARKPLNAPLWRRYDLPERPVLGPTSLDNDLAMILAHMGGLDYGAKLVLDPFCGTGGILISASHRNGTCWGSDLDSRVLRGWGVAQINTGSDGSKHLAKSNIFQNFDHYKLARPEIVRGDNCNTPWRPRGIFDAIITDPPYGIRAMSRKTGCGTLTKDNIVTNTISHPVDDIITDLIANSVKLLCGGGMLIFLLPVNHETRLEQLRSVQELCLRSGLQELYLPCYQELHGGKGRYAISMRKM